MSFPAKGNGKKRSGGPAAGAPLCRCACRSARWLAGIALIPAFFPSLFLSAPLAAAPAEPVPQREIIQQGAQPVARWKALWDQARARTRAGDSAAAAALYEEVLRLKEDIQEARWELVRLWLALRKPEQALPHLERLVEMAPANGEYRNALAGVLLQRGQHGRSVELFGRVLETEPGNVTALRGIGEGLLAAGKRSEALPYLERWYRLEPAAPRLRRQLAELYYELGLYEKARPFVAELAAASPDRETLQRAAVTHARLGLAAQAAEYWKKVLRREPANKEAQAFLAEYYEREGQGDEALAFLLPRLEREPENAGLLRRIGQLYLAMERPARALPYLERYVRQKPGDRETLRLVVDIHAGLGNRAEALANLERLLAVEPQLELAKLKQAAYLYEAQGQLERALPLYERIIESTPDDPEALSRLAQALSAVGDEQAALALWEHLGRRQKLLDALEGLHGQEPANRVVMLRLATMYLAKGAMEKSRQMFDRLTAAGERSPDFLAARASYHERTGRLDHALEDYEASLSAWPLRHELRLRCLKLAGILGYVDRVSVHAEALAAAGKEGEALPHHLLLVANAYRDGGLWAHAAGLYAQALAQAGAPKERADILLDISQLHQLAGRPYEAEQEARLALLAAPEDREASLRLFDLALQRKAFAEAAVWLAQLEHLDHQGVAAAERGSERVKAAAFQAEKLRVRLLAAQGEHREAIRRLQALLAGLPSDTTARGSLGQDSRLRHDLVVLLGRSLLATGRAAEARALLRPEWSASGENLAAAVLLLEIYETLGQGALAREVFAQARASAQEDAARLIELMQLCRQAGRQAEVLTLAWAQPELLGRSLVVQRAVIEAAANRGEQEQALVLLAELSGRHVGEHDLILRRSELLAQRGRLAEALERLALLPVSERQQPAAQLTLARIRWGMGERKASLQALRDALMPSVEEELVAVAQAQGLALPVVAPPTLWRRMVTGTEEPMPVAAVVMAPQQLLDAAAAAPGLSRAAAPFYARFQWQRQIGAELRAKAAVERREYFTAAREYERLVREYPVDGSVLYDLAGVYSKLGHPVDEAAIYKTLQARGEEYPGLAEAGERNRLQRQPHSAVSYRTLREEGRGGHKAIQQERVALTHRHTPGLQQEVVANLARIEYRATDRASTAKANRAEASYAKRLFSGLTLTAGGGISSLEEGGGDVVLARCSVAGDLGDRLWSSLSFQRDVVEDTVASLTRAIVQEAVNADLGLDLLPRLQVGGGYDYTGFSDNNWTQGYDLWAAYILVTDPTLLQVSYTYDFKDSLEAPRLGPLLIDGFAAEDHPYWAPRSYWQKRLQVFFRHQLGDDPYGREAPRYYTASYTMIYDSRGYPLQTWEGSFFVEWSPRLLLEASAEVTTGQEYRSRNLFFSLIHRW
ncbi:MAG: tetratricopeptide repeat protein [Thermodesulfobacteriota bacterium]